MRAGMQAAALDALFEVRREALQRVFGESSMSPSGEVVRLLQVEQSLEAAQVGRGQRNKSKKNHIIIPHVSAFAVSGCGVCGEIGTDIKGLSVLVGLASTSAWQSVSIYLTLKRTGCCRCICWVNQVSGSD